ncbi:MAG: glycerophosphodiester phosphodiesterase family protein [Bdellovibrionota bacterium]
MLVIAHRGYSEKYPENTLLAFQEAIKLRASAIELDIHLTKDNELVVTHDFKLGRCVQASGTVNTYTLSELTSMDAGSFKGSEFKNEKVPSLESVLSLINHQCPLNIEIKRNSP